MLIFYILQLNSLQFNKKERLTERS